MANRKQKHESNTPGWLLSGCAGVILLAFPRLALSLEEVSDDVPPAVVEALPGVRRAQAAAAWPAEGAPDAGVDSVASQQQGSRNVRMPGASGVGRQGREMPGIVPPVATPADQARLPAAVQLPENAARAGLSQKEESNEANLRWGIPPIRWGGAVGYSLQRSSASSGQSSMSQGVFSSLNAASYIYAPWAATVAGRLGVTTTSSGSSASSGATSGVSDNQSRNASVVGGGEINIFPSSRFPFQAFFDRSDSRASGNLVTNDYVNTRFGLRQTYRAEDGYTHGGMQFDQSTVNSSLNGRDTVTALSGNYGTELGIVKNSFSGRYSLGQRDLTGEKARLLGLNSAHNATLDDNINLSANVSYLDNSLSGGTGIGSFGDTRTRFLQLNTFGTWMPEFEDSDDLPLTLSGSVRYGSLHNEFSGVAIDSRNIGGNLNALYRFTNNFTVGANVALNQVSTVGSRSILLTLLGMNATYVSNPLTFGNFSYNWNTSGTINWQSGSGEIPANLATGEVLGHTLSRLFAISETGTLSLSLSQTVNANQSQSIGNSTSLSHSLALSYGSTWGERFSGNTSVSLSDILTSGVNAQHYQMLNVGFNGMGQLSSQSSANVNLQFNWNQQKTDDQQFFGFQNGTATTAASNETQHMSVLGTASYTHTRFLGYRGLRYNLMFTADTRLRDDRLLGNTNGEINRARWTLSNRLDYRIGLLDFRITAATNDVGGKKNALLFFQVSRQIGAY